MAVGAWSIAAQHSAVQDVHTQLTKYATDFIPDMFAAAERRALEFRKLTRAMIVKIAIRIIATRDIVQNHSVVQRLAVYI